MVTEPILDNVTMFTMFTKQGCNVQHNFPGANWNLFSIEVNLTRQDNCQKLIMHKNILFENCILQAMSSRYIVSVSIREFQKYKFC